MEAGEPPVGTDCPVLGGIGADSEGNTAAAAARKVDDGAYASPRTTRLPTSLIAGASVPN
jgi:hypothetical protein